MGGATPPRKFPGAAGCSSDEDAADSAEIESFDNFFDAATQEESLRLMERPKWSFTGGRIPSQFWHMDGLAAEPFFRQKLFSRICKSLGEEYDVVRIYANGQTATQHGSPHTDDGDFTFLYYPNPRWKPSWGGAPRRHPWHDGDNPLLRATASALRKVSRVAGTTSCAVRCR